MLPIENRVGCLANSKSWKNERHSSVDRVFKPVIYNVYSFHGVTDTEPAFDACGRAGIVYLSA
jgi:hypothetical protein